MQAFNDLYKIRNDHVYLYRTPIKGPIFHRIHVAQDITCYEIVKFPEEIDEGGQAIIRARFNTDTELYIHDHYISDNIEIVFEDLYSDLSAIRVINLFKKYGLDFDNFIKQVYNKFVKKFNDMHCKGVLYNNLEYYWDDDRHCLSTNVYDFNTNKIIEHEPIQEIDIELLEME